MDYEKIGGVRRCYEPAKVGDEIALRIPYDFLLEAILDTIRRNVDRIGRLILVPQMYIVHLNPLDRGWRRDKEDLVIGELINDLSERRAEFSNPQTEAEPFHIEFADDEELEPFEIAVSFRLVAPLAKITQASPIPSAQVEHAGGLKPLEKAPKPAQPVKVTDSVPPDPAPQSLATAPKPPKPATTAVEIPPEEPLSVFLFLNQKLAAHRPLEKGRPFIVGRSLPPTVDLHLEDRTGEVSGKHLQFVWTGDRIECEVPGDNGCKIDGKEYEEGSKTSLDESAIILIEGGKDLFQLEFRRE